VTGVRIVRISHSAVVSEYRKRERALRRHHGYDIHLVCPPAFLEGGRMVTASPDPEVPVHVVSVRGRTDHPILYWYSRRALRRVLRSVQPDIVDLHQEPYSLAAAGALGVIKQEVPQARICIYTAQNILKRYPPPFRQLERRALRAATAAYPCSTEAGNVLRAKGFDGTLHLLPLGVTLRTGAVRPARTGGLRVGFVGRLEAYKGPALALAAFAEAARDLDASLEIVGSGSELADLRRRAGALGLESRVEFPGAIAQEEALDRIAGYDVLLVPSLTTASWKEQFGRVPVQALEAGTPVIASDSGSLREVLDGCGELVPEGDLAALTAALRRLLLEPALRAQLSAQGRRRAVEMFSWEAVAIGCDRLYRDMLAAP
jgi:glycosyltransferase involved in cell wall biosynthesis